MKRMDAQLILLLIVGVATIVLSIWTHISNNKKDGERDIISKALAQKTNKVVELQDEIIKLQTKNNELLTGGDGFPYIQTEVFKDNEIMFLATMEGSISIFNVNINFADPLLWEKLPKKDKHTKDEFFSVQKSFHFDELNKEVASIMKFELGQRKELKYSFFLSCRNGSYQQITTISKEEDGKIVHQSTLNSIDGVKIKEWSNCE